MMTTARPLLHLAPMRRIAQASLVRAGASIDSSDISEAIDDMLFAGGRLNVRLLGGAQQMARAAG